VLRLRRSVLSLERRLRRSVRNVAVGSVGVRTGRGSLVVGLRRTGRGILDCVGLRSIFRRTALEIESSSGQIPDIQKKKKEQKRGRNFHAHEVEDIVVPTTARWRLFPNQLDKINVHHEIKTWSKVYWVR
jgi:hypothetical protein